MKVIKVLFPNSRIEYIHIRENTTLKFFDTLIKLANKNNKARWNNKLGVIEVVK